MFYNKAKPSSYINNTLFFQHYAIKQGEVALWIDYLRFMTEQQFPKLSLTVMISYAFCYAHSCKLRQLLKNLCALNFIFGQSYVFPIMLDGTADVLKKAIYFAIFEVADALVTLPPLKLNRVLSAV